MNDFIGTIRGRRYFNLYSHIQNLNQEDKWCLHHMPYPTQGLCTQGFFCQKRISSLFFTLWTQLSVMKSAMTSWNNLSWTLLLWFLPSVPLLYWFIMLILLLVGVSAKRINNWINKLTEPSSASGNCSNIFYINNTLFIKGTPERSESYFTLGKKRI